MYSSSSYSHVPGRYTLEAQKKQQHQRLQRSQGKSCGYYMRIIFFFSSLIQSLIIVSLVLFLVYGKKQDSAASGCNREMEQNFGRVSLENVDLRKVRFNLTRTLNLTVMGKLQVDLEVLAMRNLSNTSYVYIMDINKELNQCTVELSRRRLMICPKTKDSTECQIQLIYQKKHAQMLETRLNNTKREHTIQAENLRRERDNFTLEAIELRKDKSMLEMDIQSFRLSCKEDIMSSLSGITNVSQALLEKIKSLFPHNPFQLTCEKQRENLEQIRRNCTSLSQTVVDTLQRYLDTISTNMSSSMAQVSQLGAKNYRLTKDYDLCLRKSNKMIADHRSQMGTKELQCDAKIKNLLDEKNQLFDDKEVLNKDLALKESRILQLQEQNRQLNISCCARNNFRYINTVSQLSRSPPSPVSTATSTGSAGNPFIGRPGGMASVMFQQHLQKLQRYAAGKDKKKN